jgi:AcrR family transcriptional regulator
MGPDDVQAYKYPVIGPTLVAQLAGTRLNPVSRRDENKAATRAALLRAGRKVFGTEGYAGASLADIAKEARVTTGAVYHHFEDKAALFRVVAESVEKEILDLVIGAAEKLPENDQIARMLGGFDAMLAAIASPEMQRIALMDAPVVFGPENWRKVEEQYVYGALAVGISRLSKQGRLAPGVSQSVLTAMLFGAMVEAAFAVARAADPERAREEAKGSLLVLLKGVVTTN